jgi:N6-L-threonylcarbamoyladenine synthase
MANNRPDRTEAMLYNGFEETVRCKWERDRSAGADCLILGVETSCDETSAAVVRNGTEVLSNVVSSQIEIHQRFGGVVPEVASRHHMERITWVIEEALRVARTNRDALSAVAVTYGPGLIGALLVGLNAAKGIALAQGIPLIGVQHIAGHIAAAFLQEEVTPPFIALVVSGGHTELVLVEAPDRFSVLGRTRDDAAGEAYDKVARAMGLGYPGGPRIDRLAQQGDPERVVFPRAWLEEDSLDFSFSGLKSAVLNTLQQAVRRGEPLRNEDIAAGFQQAVVDVLVGKTVMALQRFPGLQHVVVAGGVAANQGLRHALKKRADEMGFRVFFPPLALCTDNAAMIAAAAYPRYCKGEWDSLAINAVANVSVDEW